MDALHAAVPHAGTGGATTALAERPSAPSAPAGDDVLDLCVVGAGPAGLSCSLQAKAHGLRCLTLEQEQLGGTVARYPRRKLVLTQPVDLPLVTGVQLLGLEQADGHLVVATSGGTWRARHVCLALGRRG